MATVAGYIPTFPERHLDGHAEVAMMLQVIEGTVLSLWTHPVGHNSRSNISLGPAFALYFYFKGLNQGELEITCLKVLHSNIHSSVC